MAIRLSLNRFGESYVDTISKLYHYSTSTYAKNRQSQVIGTDKGYTFSEFKKVCDGMSKLMSCYGIGAGDGVAILSQGQPNWAIAFMAASAFGRVSIPILPDSSEVEVANILNHSEAKALFVSKRFASKVSQECLDKLVLVVDIDELKVIKRSEEQFTCDGRTADPGADDLAALIYTSGTTGSAKGVMLSHRNLCQNIFASYHACKRTYKDRWLSILPMAHTYEMSIGFLYPFYVGACVYYMDRALNIPMLMKAFKEVHPTTILTVPMIIEKVVNSSIKPTIQKSPTLRWMEKTMPHVLYFIIGKRLANTFGGKISFFGIGGAKLNTDVEAFLRKIHFPYAIGYGMTEAAPLICTANAKQTYLGSTGGAAYGVSVKLINVNPETGEGEVVACGDNIMLGYYKDPIRTREMFTEDGWLKTNDLAVMDEKGRVFIKGRLNNMILGPSGENIYPEEIEKVINDIADVTESLVVERDGKLVALVQMDENAINWNLSGEKDFYEKLEQAQKAIMEQVNKVVGKSSKVSSVEIQKEPFKKTATMKIRRFLYKDGKKPESTEKK